MTRSIGTPTWIEFRSTDMASSKQFYGQLFGWEFTDSGSQMAHYQMVTKDQQWIGGGMDVAGATCPDGSPMPANWEVYLAVDDVDERARLATEHGGTVLAGPHDAGTSGRFAVVMAPDGATVGLWQAGEVEGYAFTGQPGSPVWFELMTQDFQASIDFYRAVFDYDIQPMTGQEYEGMTYATNGPMDTASSGICDARDFIPADKGSFWRIYFQVESCDPAVARLKELGGSVLDGPEDTPFGRLATVADPCGASFQMGATSEATDPAFAQEQA